MGAIVVVAGRDGRIDVVIWIGDEDEWKARFNRQSALYVYRLRIEIAAVNLTATMLLDEE